MTFAPPGWPTVIPRIVVSDAERFVAFLKYVFSADGDFRRDAPAEVRIRESVVLVSESGARESTTAFLYVYVPDVDSTYARALSAGARSLESPANLPYGDRRAMVEDPWGNRWQIATRLVA
jgi:PhnB protein